MPDKDLDERLIKEWFQKWKTILETGYIDGHKSCDFQRLEAAAYLGFRPNHPQVAKTKRWLKRLARKPSELSQAFWFLTTEHFGAEDDYLTMSSYHAMLHGIKRFLKATDLYKIKGIKKCFNDMYKSMYFCWIPKRDRKKYKKCMHIWHLLADAED